jgi:hypothetical protein
MFLNVAPNKLNNMVSKCLKNKSDIEINDDNTIQDKFNVNVRVFIIDTICKCIKSYIGEYNVVHNIPELIDMANVINQSTMCIIPNDTSTYNGKYQAVIESKILARLFPNRDLNAVVTPPTDDSFDCIKAYINFNNNVQSQGAQPDVQCIYNDIRTRFKGLFEILKLSEKTYKQYELNVILGDICERMGRNVDTTLELKIINRINVEIIQGMKNALSELISIDYKKEDPTQLLPEMSLLTSVPVQPGQPVQPSQPSQSGQSGQPVQSGQSVFKNNIVRWSNLQTRQTNKKDITNITNQIKNAMIALKSSSFIISNELKSAVQNYINKTTDKNLTNMMQMFKNALNEFYKSYTHSDITKTFNLLQVYVDTIKYIIPSPVIMFLKCIEEVLNNLLVSRSPLANILA